MVIPGVQPQRPMGVARRRGRAAGHTRHRRDAAAGPRGGRGAEAVVEAARREHAAGRAVLIVTARQARYRGVTAMWLALHGVPSAAMWMRGDGDPRPDRRRALR